MQFGSAITAAGLTLLAVGCASRTTSPASVAAQQPDGFAPAAPRRSGIDWATHAKLAWAHAAEYRALSVVVISERVGAAATESLATAVRDLGGHVETRFDDIGYVRAVMPVRVIPQLAQTRGVADYEVVTRAGIANHNHFGRSSIRYRLYDRSTGEPETPESGGASSTPDPPPLSAADLSIQPAYLALDEIRADRFARLAPLADGRGATVAVVEGPFDFAHEALRQARRTAGDTVRKIAGLLDVSWHGRRAILQPDTDPRGVVVVREGSPTRAVRVDGRGAPTVNPDGQVQLPDGGTWRVGVWARRITGTSGVDTIQYLVAWRDTLAVWVDLNRDGDLRNDGGPVPNISARLGMGRFPAYSAEGASAPVTFVVAFAPDGLPHIYDSAPNDHTMMAAGTAAGSGFLGGEAGGVAPGARLLNVLAQFDVEDLIVAARDTRADVITYMAYNGHFPATGGSLSARILDRVTSVYGKPIVISTLNAGPGLGTVQHFAAARGTIGVGAYVSARSYQLNESLRVADEDNLALYSSRGPAADGAFKPDVVAPSHVVTTSSCGTSAQALRRAAFRLPPCYMVGGGTSNAAPFAAGAIARLISAARLSALPANAYDARMIAWALTASGRQIDGVGLHEQGAGLIQLDSAWQLLRLGIDIPNIESSGSVENAYARFLLHRGRGPGLFLREGWETGRRETRSITLLRTTGPAQERRYRLRWRGNDGTFALADSLVVLRRGSPVVVRVTVAPESPGIHSAAIELVDVEHAVVVKRVATTVIAGLQLVAESGYSVSHTDTIPWPRTRSVFIEVPKGTAALRVELEIASGGVQVDVRGPLAADGIGSALSGWDGRIRDAVIQVADPTPGTWEFTLGPPRLSGAEPADDAGPLVYTLRATAMMAHAESRLGPAGENTVTFTNVAASVSSASIRTSVGSRAVYDGVIAPSNARQLLPLDPIVIPVERGTTSLRVSLEADGQVRAAGTRADLHVYYCAEARQCQERTPIFVEGDRQEIVVADPYPGTWKVVIGPVSVRDRPSRYSLSVITTHPKWGDLLPVSGSDTAARALAHGEQRRASFRTVDPHAGAGAHPLGATTIDLVGIIDLLAAEPRLGPDWRVRGQAEPAILAQHVIALSTPSRPR